MGFWNKWFGRKPSSPDMASPPGTPSLVKGDPREFFLAQVEQRLRARETTGTITRHENDFGLRVVISGREMSLFLHRLYADTRELSPEDRERAIDHFLTALSKTPEKTRLTWEEARPRLRPVLRPVTFGQGIESAKPEHAMVGHDVLPFLRELISIDYEDRAAYLQREEFESWGVGFQEVLAAAHANLARTVPLATEPYERVPGTIWSVESDQFHESSWLMRPGFLASFAKKVEGRPIAIVPDRTTLWIAGDAHPETVARLCESAEREYQASARATSPALYTVDEELRVVPYELPPEDELAAQVRRGHVMLAASEYKSQKDMLDQAKGGEEQGAFVANVSIVSPQGSQEAFTYCVWSEDLGTEGLLPEVDLVALGTTKEEVLLVPWPEVRRIVGDRLVAEPGLAPPRYRPTAWPTPEMFEHLRAAARK
ncbi:DUF1444 domain-containing protein [Melittangium boletus]|uniref:DUF1444 domain-containing protein n=1 Tax=Melittangium boletus DSM 14713 TaxID=1294270 RepID=A0A250IJB3_9BACT|nr:DUF1444 domain-containing protein [Melittangium boletus]ATB31227.1 hypothetical protein MEBOL_004689 [Melittangium boletus DSM 14713]